MAQQAPARPGPTPEGVGAGGARDTVLALHRVFAEATGVSIPLRLWDGTEVGPEDASFRVTLHHPWSLRRMGLPPSDLAAGEAYALGAIDIEGSVEAAMATMSSLRIPARAAARFARLLLKLPRPPRLDTGRRAHLKGRRHSQARDQAAIAFHYDLPQAFYEQFLDEALVYSCAYFSSPDEELEDAQRRKLELVCRKLRLRPGSRLLDIGCGWGSLLIHAARHHDAVGTGVTLSRTQAEAGRERARAAGVSDRVEIRLADYRELEGTWDAVASVGMFEHVGPKNLGAYFSAALRLTAPGGLFCNHGIVTGAARDVRKEGRRTFVDQYVFPDGGLVPAWMAVHELQQAGFHLLDVEQLRPHYTLTLREWVRRLERNHEAAARTASEVDYRIWRAYMAGAAHSFDSGDLGVIQILGSRGAALPLGRAWMIPPT